jgi:ribose transport system substrate-binding protein
MLRFLHVVLVVASALSLSASAFAQDAKSKGTIGVSLLTMTNPFFIEIADAMKAEAAKHGMTVVVTAGEMDVAKQKDQVADFIVKRVDAIVLCPTDSKAIGTSIAAANKAGIPVFTADIAALAGPDAKVVSHVATDNLGGGRMAAKAMIEALKGGGKVAIIDHPEVESVILRAKGFEEEIAKHNERQGTSGGGKIEIVSKLPGRGTKDQSFKAAEDILQAHPDLAGIFAINDPSALGAVAALEKADRIKQVKVVGFDGQKEARQAIKDGKIYADPVQSPQQIGQKAVQAIVAYMAGDDVPAETLIPTTLYRQADGAADPSLR